MKVVEKCDRGCAQIYVQGSGVGGGGFRSLDFRVQGLGLGIWGLGLGIWDWGLGIWGLGLRFRAGLAGAAGFGPGFGSRGWVSGFRRWWFPMAKALGVSHGKGCSGAAGCCFRGHLI